MKVAYLLPSLRQPGGWRRHSLAFLSAIACHVEPLLFVAQAEAAEARRLFPDWPVYALPTTQQAAWSPRGAPRLLAAFASVQGGRFPAVDLVHSLEAYPTGLVGSWLARKLNAPHVLTTHGTYGLVWNNRTLDRLAYRRVLSGAQLVCPVSHGTARLLVKHFGPWLKDARVWPILNGNDFADRIPRHDALERPWPATPTLLSVGEVKPRKGQMIALQAFSQVQAHLPQARYRIVGRFREQQAYYQQMKSYIASRHLRGVEFLGVVGEDDLQRCYQEASLFILTPQEINLNFEGFGLVYLEAGAYGLPVVGTRTGGVPDAVLDGETGFLAAPHDVSGLALAIQRLLTDPDLARELGQANRRWAESLTWQRCAAEQFQAYSSLFSPGGVGASTAEGHLLQSTGSPGSLFSPFPLREGGGGVGSSPEAPPS